MHEPTLYVHYSGVWDKLDKDSFVIILTGVFINNKTGDHGVNIFLNKINNSSYNYFYINDIIKNKIKYQYVVTNHMMSGSSLHTDSLYKIFNRKLKNSIKQYINLFYKLSGSIDKYQINLIDPVQYQPLQIGIKQIRFMYGADISDAWSLDAWNKIYDLFLCHGPNDEMHLKKRFKGKTAIMGYPRYDGYFSPNLDVDDVVVEFTIDRTKQTILWMPTLDVFGDNACSIIPFAKEISGLMADFNVIVRPHPISLRRELVAIELLKSLNYNIDRDATRDMNKLFKVADFIFCDHGGSPFGALYLGKKLVLLRTPGYSDSLMAKGSSNLELMKYFPSIPVDEVNSLRELLNDASYWKVAIESSRPLCNKYFSNYRGKSSAKAAEILTHLELI